MSNDELKLKLSVEGSGQAAAAIQTGTVAPVKEATQALRQMNTAAKEGVAPFDAVAAANARLAARAQETAQTVTTSTQKIIAEQAKLRVLTSNTSPLSRGEGTAYASGLLPSTSPTTSGTFSPPPTGGMSIPGPAGLFVAGAAAALSFATAVHEAGEQMLTARQKAQQLGDDIRSGIETNAGGAITTTTSQIRTLTNEIDAFDRRWTATKFLSGIKGAIGLESDNEKRDQKQAEKSEMIRIQAEATKELIAQMGRESAILDQLIAGNLEKARIMTREDRDERERAANRKQIKGLSEADKLTAMQALNERQTKRARLELKQDLDAMAFQAQEDEKHWREQLARENEQFDKDKSAEAKKKQADADAMAFQAQEDEKQWREQLAKENEQFDKDKAAEAKKKQEDADRAAKEAEAAARQAQADDARLEQLKDRGQVLQEQLAGESEKAKLAQIQKQLDREIAAIEKGMAPDRQAAAKDVAAANAELEKQIVIQQRLNKEAAAKVEEAANAMGAQKARAAETPQEAAVRRDAEKKAASENRAAAQNLANKWAAQERNAGRSPSDAEIAAKKKALMEADRGDAANPKDLADRLAKPAAKRKGLDPTGQPMSEKDIARDEPVEPGEADGGGGIGSAIAGMVEKAKAAASDMTSQVVAAIQAADFSVQVDVQGVASAVTAALEGVRSEMQTQIDDLASRIATNQ